MEEIILQKLQTLEDKMESLSLSTKEILTLDEAVIYLHVSKSYLYKLTCAKKIAHYKPSGKLIFFKKSELDEWILESRESSTNEVTEKIMSNLKVKK